MRIRSTKPEFWRSERVASVSWDARLVLKGLESYVDDNGVGKDDLALIVSDVFPRDLSRNAPGTLRRVSEAMTELHQAGLLWRYTHEDTSLVYIAFWESVQRIEKPGKGRNPRPDGTLDYRESVIREAFPEPSGSTPVTLRPGTGEQGNRGRGEQGIETHSSPNVSTDRARELSEQELEDVVGVVREEFALDIDILTAATFAEFILEPATKPVEDPAAYIRAAIVRSPKRTSGLLGEAERQAAKVRVTS